MTKDTFLRSTTWVVLVSFCSMITQPVQAALRLPDPVKTAKQRTNQPAAPETLADKQSRLLAEIHNILKELEPEAAYPTPAPKKGEDTQQLRAIGPSMRIKTERAQPAGSTVDRAAKIKALKAKHAQLAQLAAAADADFAAVKQHLIDKKLPAELLQRHNQAEADYHERRTQYDQLMQAMLDADASKTDTTAHLRDLAAFMAKYPNQQTHTAGDPNKLPFRAPDGKVRAPVETEQGFKTSLFHPFKLHGRQAYTVAAAGSLSGISLPSTAVSATPTAADLAETEDVQLTPAIRAQAAALNNNPVQIHNWVRNTIEFIPSYGSIQGADLTLQAKRGNPTDTASLEIALLRAAGIPARYAYGTIQIPADQAMNWVGGVSKAEAAQSLLGQGGIPNVGMVSGGQIKYIKLEHVWVEAYVDYVPSRGAVNRVGDTWIALDPSFKQYNYTQGMDLKGQVPLDAQALLDQAKVGATVNETEGWVQNLNAANLQAQLTQYQSQVKTYIDAQNPNATVGDVLGAKKIINQSPSILMGTLPYKTIVTGAKFSEIPTNLKHQFHFNLYDSALDRALDSPTLTFTKNLAYLAGKKITLSFSPASQADIDLIKSYLPKPHADGTPIKVDELPSSLPGYLIHLKAEIRVDGQVVVEGGSYILGQELTSGMGLNTPGRGWDDGEDNHPIAGEYQAIGLNLQGVVTGQLTALKRKLEQTKAKLQQYSSNPNDTSSISDLTKEDLSGDMLYSGILAYFASVDGNDQLIARTGNQVISYRLPSYGTFMAAAQPHYWFGIARNVSFPGLVMDVDRLAYHVEAKDVDSQKRVAYMRQVGSTSSAFEHSVPEKLFSDPTKIISDPAQPQGISAIKAISIAAANGQRIYTLNQQNQALHSSLLAQITIDPDARSEIQNALIAGKEVTVHASPLTQKSWVGSGYIVIDPYTGAGAYKISGGANGGWLEENVGTAIDIFAAFLEMVGGIFASSLSKVLGAFTKVIDFANIVQNCSGSQLVGGLGLLMGSIIVSAGIIGFFGAYFIIPALIIFLYSVMMTILMASLLDDYVGQECKK